MSGRSHNAHPFRRKDTPNPRLVRTLITAGVYQRIHHPMYAASWIAAPTQPLLVHKWIAGVLVIRAFAAMWFIRVPSEETMMRADFGETYDAYCERVVRPMPR